MRSCRSTGQVGRGAGAVVRPLSGPKHAELGQEQSRWTPPGRGRPHRWRRRDPGGLGARPATAGAEQQQSSQQDGQAQADRPDGDVAQVEAGRPRQSRKHSVAVVGLGSRRHGRLHRGRRRHRRRCRDPMSRVVGADQPVHGQDPHDQQQDRPRPRGLSSTPTGHALDNAPQPSFVPGPLRSRLAPPPPRPGDRWSRPGGPPQPGPAASSRARHRCRRLALVRPRDVSDARHTVRAS